MLEDLRSEKRILQAEREETLKKLLSIQSDLEDVTAMEKKVAVETQSIDIELLKQCQDDDYLLTRGRKS